MTQVTPLIYGLAKDQPMPYLSTECATKLSTEPLKTGVSSHVKAVNGNSSGGFHSYPSFLWITWCKILFIFSDQIWKTRCSVAQLDYRQPKSNINQRIEQHMWKKLHCEYSAHNCCLFFNQGIMTCPNLAHCSLLPKLKNSC